MGGFCFFLPQLTSKSDRARLVVFESSSSGLILVRLFEINLARISAILSVVRSSDKFLQKKNIVSLQLFTQLQMNVFLSLENSTIRNHRLTSEYQNTQILENRLHDKIRLLLGCFCLKDIFVKTVGRHKLNRQPSPMKNIPTSFPYLRLALLMDNFPSLLASSFAARRSLMSSCWLVVWNQKNEAFSSVSHIIVSMKGVI